MTDVEAAAQLSLTTNLIALYGVPVALQRPGEYRTTPGGGTAPQGGPEALPEVRRYFARVNRDAIQHVSTEGDQALVWGILLGLPDDDMRKDDEFTGPDGLRYRIRYVESETRAWETRAEVSTYV